MLSEQVEALGGHRTARKVRKAVELAVKADAHFRREQRGRQLGKFGRQ